MFESVKNYRLFLDGLPELIRKSSFKNVYLMKKIGLSKPIFYERMKNKNFSLSEVERIVKILEYEQRIDKKIEDSENDIIAERVIPHSELFGVLKRGKVSCSTPK